LRNKKAHPYPFPKGREKASPLSMVIVGLSSRRGRNEFQFFKNISFVV